MNRKLATGLAVASALAIAGCASSSPSPSTGPATHAVLTEESNTGVTFTQDFNPFNTSSFATKMNLRTLIYEPLYEFDALDPAQSHPWLATSYTFSTDGKDLTFAIRPNITWSDGKAFTAQDVAFTFKTIKDNNAANASGIPAQASDPTVSGNSVTIHFNTAQYTNLFSIAGSTYIVPQHLWSSISNPATAVVANPVGTGPYTLKSFSTQVVKFAANSKYWGGIPPISEVDVPYYATNDAASSALVAGQLDWAGNDIANIQQNFVSLNPQTNHYWFASGNTVTLWFNVKYGALGDPQVRKAISAGIDRTALALLGESGYEAPATSSTGLILPNFSQYLSATAKNDLKPNSDPATVKSLLTADGYKAPTGSGNCTASTPANCYTKNGQIISFNIEDPVPYSDYWEDAQLISQQLQAEGINCTTKGDNPDTGWYADYTAGNFQSMIHWGNGGPTPFVQYQNWLDSTQPVSAGNYGGFKSDAADQALTTLEGTNPSDTAAITTAVQALGQIMTDQAPQVPLLYGADWNVYSSAHFTGWPDGSNPYMDPSPNDPELPYILMHLRPV
ncbi:MAG TPA: ABC transporter substrate-binding protein [Candidatus Acidoferrales bacterium]|jgi:peptide/nickel transport system substrate-binding protein|nr:ABC transporter substrate-binding protein [Candidatus Acidoferrales bacterium]